MKGLLRDVVLRTDLQDRSFSFRLSQYADLLVRRLPFIRLTPLAKVLRLTSFMDQFSEAQPTVHYNREYGELYGLEKDSGEDENLWDLEEYQDLKRDLLLEFVHAEMKKAPLPMDRVAHA